MTAWLQERRKAIVAFLQAAAQAVNAFVPSYSTHTKEIVAVVVAGLGLAGVHQIRNRLAAPARARR